MREEMWYNSSNRINNDGKVFEAPSRRLTTERANSQMATSDHTTIDSTTEEWRDIPGYEGLYQASNLGRIRSFVVTGSPRTQNSHKRRKSPPHLLSLVKHTRGYVMVTLSRGVKKGLLLVHVLVLSAFVSERESGMVVNHKNGIKNDNRLVNLEWVTPIENARHYRDVLGRHGQQRGTQFKSAKLNEDKVREVRRLRSAGVSRRLIAERFGVSETTIRMVDESKTWTHVKDAGDE